MGLSARIMRVLARTARVVASCALAWSLLGCGDGGSDTADRYVPPLPRIDNPKDAAHSDPCTLLSNEQRTRLGLTPGSPWRGNLGPGCAWRGDASLKVTIMVSSDQGLDALAKRSDPAAARVRLNGYPALETFTRGGAYCRYDVGNAPRQALVATMSGGIPDSCRALQPILTGMVDRLPPLGG